jgi:predicted DNA-binding antitoxin AbrB/MazE fold protein
MAITVTAVYEDGVLKPAEPLPLRDHDTVQVTVHIDPSPLVRAYGIIGWTGSAEDLERLALDPEFLPEEDS